MNPNSLMAELKTSTWPLHQEIEKKMPFFSQEFSRETYQNLLGKFYGFYKAYENRLQPLLQETGLQDFYQNRFKTPALEKDIATFAPAAAPSLPEAPALPQLHSRASVLGSLYVIEGSTLGGQIITRHLTQKMGVPANEVHFFSGYGADTGPRWKEFQALVDGQNFSSAERAEAVQAANDTFSTLMNWLFPVK